MRRDAKDELDAIANAMAARGLGQSGGRIKRQLGAIRSQMFIAINWVLGEASRLPSSKNAGWVVVGRQIQENLSRHLYSLYDLINVNGLAGTGIQQAISNHTEQLRQDLIGELNDFRAGIWSPQQGNSKDIAYDHEPIEQPQKTKSMSNAKIFVVHGRDDAMKTDVARLVERLGLDAVILHEQPNAGRTLLAKFMEVASDAAFAIVLMSPDDVGGLKDTEHFNPRARQNVVFELGFFLAKLGSAKVCALVAGEVEKPSDFEAVTYVAYGPQTNWKTELARELHHAGIHFDAAKLLN